MGRCRSTRRSNHLVDKRLGPGVKVKPMPSWTAEVLFVELIMQVGMTLEGGGGWGVAGESAELWTRTGEFWRAAFTLNGCQDEKAALHYLHFRRGGRWCGLFIHVNWQKRWSSTISSNICDGASCWWNSDLKRVNALGEAHL